MKQLKRNTRFGVVHDKTFLDFDRWQINDCLTVELGPTPKLLFETWMNNHTTIKNTLDPTFSNRHIRVIQNFLYAGFTPLVGCHGTQYTPTPNEDEKPKTEYRVEDDMSWFIFDGINENGAYCNLAVNYNESKETFTVYNHSDYNNKRIGIFDDIETILRMTCGYIPINIRNNDYFIDWHKVTITNTVNLVDISLYKNNLTQILNKTIESSYHQDIIRGSIVYDHGRLSLKLDNMYKLFFELSNNNKSMRISLEKKDEHLGEPYEPCYIDVIRDSKYQKLNSDEPDHDEIIEVLPKLGIVFSEYKVEEKEDN